MNKSASPSRPYQFTMPPFSSLVFRTAGFAVNELNTAVRSFVGGKRSVMSTCPFTEEGKDEEKFPRVSNRCRRLSTACGNVLVHRIGLIHALNINTKKALDPPDEVVQVLGKRLSDKAMYRLVNVLFIVYPVVMMFSTILIYKVAVNTTILTRLSLA